MEVLLSSNQKFTVGGGGGGDTLSEGWDEPMTVTKVPAKQPFKAPVVAATKHGKRSNITP